MDSYLIHHGILGQKWGVRRYQNKNGSLTKAGRERLKELYDDPKTHANIGKRGKQMRGALDESVRALQDSSKKFADARKQYEEEYYKSINSDYFKKIERKLSDQIWDNTVDDWTLEQYKKQGVNNKNDFYEKISSNKYSLGYIWDEDEPSYYLRNDSHFKSFQKSEKQMQDAGDNWSNECKRVANKILGEHASDIIKPAINGYKNPEETYEQEVSGILRTLSSDKYKIYKYGYVL